MMGNHRVTNIRVLVRLDRTIQYAASCVLIAGVGDYWMPAFAGMTAGGKEGRQ
jgi:hypothetical protein